MAVAQDLAIDTACPFGEVRERSAGRREGHGRARGVLEGARHSDSVRCRRASPSSALAAAVGTARRSRCTRAGSRVGKSAAGTAGSEVSDAADDVARRRGAGCPRRTPAEVTSSAHKTPGVRDSTRGMRS